VNNPELTTSRPAPFVELLPAAVPVLVPLLPEAVGLEPDACAGSVVRGDPAVGEDGLTEAVLEPYSCAEEKVTQFEDAGILGVKGRVVDGSNEAGCDHVRAREISQV
jgi:hypothetical protein